MFAAVAPGRTPLSVFNALMPKERGAVRIVADAAFGPDRRQRLDLYAPRRSLSAPLPIILFLYGGGWRSGAKEGYEFVGRALAARGFLVAVADYRLAPAHPFPNFLHDNAAAVRWLRAEARTWGGDPDRLVLAGHSAGAYNAAMLAMDRRWLGEDHRAVRGWFGLCGPYDFLPLRGRLARDAFARWPRPEETQPVGYAAADAPPAFLAAGAQDQLVPPANSATLAARLRTVGAAVELRSYRRVGHVGAVTAFARPLRHRAPVLADLVAFARAVTT